MQCSVHYTGLRGRVVQVLYCTVLYCTVLQVVPSYTDPCSARCHGEDPRTLVTCPHPATTIAKWGY